MSDSEDDFMSDKFLVEAPVEKKSYTARREAQQLKSLRAGQAKNMPSLAQLEKERRNVGLSTSLFDKQGEGQASGSSGVGGASGGGGNKAMGMMMRMGWKVGEGLGKKRSASPDGPSKRARLVDGDDDEEEEAPRGGLGSNRASASASASASGRGRVEPIRVSMWAGRKGLSAREPTPPPLPTSSGRNLDALDPNKMKRLGEETESFRERQRREFGEKEIERKEFKARERLVQLDQEKGVKFHPLHVLPSDPLGTLPKPLLKRIYPAQAVSPSPSRSPSLSPEPVLGYGADKYVSEAEKLRERMRRDMLSEVKDDDEDGLLGLSKPKVKKAKAGEETEQVLLDEDCGVDWDEQVSGTKRVLAMDPATHLRFLVSQLRHEHFFCFWCAYKYASYEEMDGPRGCPGEDEDDH